MEDDILYNIATISARAIEEVEQEKGRGKHMLEAGTGTPSQIW
jgi:hypothetical protein